MGEVVLCMGVMVTSNNVGTGLIKDGEFCQGQAESFCS